MLNIVYLILFYLGLTSGLYCQVDVHDLAIGQRLTVYSDLDPSLDMDIFSDGYMDWDLSLLNFEKNTTFNIKNPRTGSAIPVIGQADILLESDQFEYYYSFQDSRLMLNGTTDVRLLDQEETHDHIIKFDGLEEFNPDILTEKEIISESIGLVELYVDDLPSEVTDTWDELNYRYVLERAIDQNMIKKAMGQLRLPMGKFDVTMVVVEQKIKQQLLAKDVLYKADDVVVKSSIPNYLSKKEIRFYIKGQSFPLIKIILDGELDDIEKIEYFNFNRDSHLSSAVKEELLIHPNPTFGKSDFIIRVKTPGEYNIVVKNILGRVIYTQDAYIEKQSNLSLNLMSLRKGSYFCSLVDHTGRALHTKKLIILKP